jgi:hypothetical protein
LKPERNSALENAFCKARISTAIAYTNGLTHMSWDLGGPTEACFNLLTFDVIAFFINLEPSTGNIILAVCAVYPVFFSPLLIKFGADFCHLRYLDQTTWAGVFTDMFDVRKADSVSMSSIGSGGKFRNTNFS